MIDLSIFSFCPASPNQGSRISAAPPNKLLKTEADLEDSK